MKKRIFYSILMTLLLVTGCYKDEFGQIQKEIKNLQDSQIAPLEQQLQAIKKSHSELNILSDELREYVALLEEASKELEGNIGKINEKIQDLRQALNDKNVKEKGEVLARLENAKSYLEGQLSTMKSTVDVLKDKYDGIQAQMDAMDALLADKYATKDWVNGTFATIEQQNALIAEVEAVKVLANELNAIALKIESDVKTYMAELRESTLGTVDSSISAKVGELATAYESAIGTVVANVTAAFNSEIESAINTSESGIMSWVDEALKDYLTTAEAEAKLAFYKGCIGAVPDGESLQSQIDDLGALIDGIKPEIEAAYKEAIKKAIEESEGKLTKKLTGEIESIKLNELKFLTDSVSALGDDVTKLWEDLGKLEDRIKTLEDQVAAINTTLAVILGETAPTLEEYISALDDELRGNDDARTAYLKNLVDALRYAVDGKDNDKSLQRCIEDIKTLLGTLPAGETSIVEWVQSSKSAIDLQLKSYATIAYVDGLRHEIDSATTDHSNRLVIISGRLGSAIEDSKTTICSWISEALADYMRGAEFDARLLTLVEKYEDLFSKGDQGLQNQINTLSISVRSAIAELQEAYKTKIDTCIKEYNSYVVKTVDAKYEEVKGKLDADSTKFDALEATIDGMKKDVQTLNVSIDSLRDIVDSLQKFVLDKDYPSLKGIVRDFDAKLKGLTGIYADLKAFNAANEAVNKVGGYKESIEKLADFKKRLEEAEAAIANYKNLAKDFDLDGKTLKEQFDALNKELGDLKTAVSGSSSLRSQLEAIEAKDTELASAIDALNATLLSRLKSFTSIAYRPDNSEGYALFTFKGTDFTSTIMFDVRPKELSAAIAKVAKIKYVSSPTRSLANMYDVKNANISSPEEGVLKADVTLPGTARETISTGVSLALFAQGEGFDFVSDFIPVSGDRMFPDKRVINVGGTGATDLRVKVYYPKESGAINKPDNGTWFKIEKVNAQPIAADFGLSYTEYKINVSASNVTTERSSVLTFSVGRGSNTLSCTVEIIQAPREKQDFLLFTPADGKIKFSWKGELIDTLTNNPYSPAKIAQDIVVTTSDALSDWTVKTAEDTQWATVTQEDNKAILEVGAGTGNANYNQTGADRTGKIVFTNATSTLDTTYTFIQFPRPQQRLAFNPDTTVGLSFGHGETEERKQTFKVKSLDGEYDWESSTGAYSWIHRSVATSGTPRTVTVWTDANPDTTARTGYISFTTKTGMNDTTYLYPIHQDAAPKQMFIFSPREGGNCYLGEDGLIHIIAPGGDDMRIYVKGDPNDVWDMSVYDKGTGNWLSGSGRKEVNRLTDWFAPSGYNYYIQISASQNNSDTDTREASIRFTCDGNTYDYKVIQDPRTADIINFSPADSIIVFYWDGRVMGDDGKPTSATSQDIEVTTGNGSTGWTVEKASDLTWANVAKRSESNANKVRISNVAVNDTGEDRTGTLTFTSETQKTYSYTFTQLKATQTTARVTISDDEVEKLIISGDGKQYKLSDSDTQWKNITTNEVDDVSGSFFLAKVKTDDGTEWSVALDPTKTSEGWGIAATKVHYRSSIFSSGDYYLGLSNYGTNQTDSPRYAEIVISNSLGVICRIPVVQEVRPAQSFTFNPELTFSDFNGGTITTTVTPDPDLDNDQWSVKDETIDDWLTVERVVRYNDLDIFHINPIITNQIKLSATQNNSPEPRTAKLVITYEGGTAEYTVTQPGREEAQTFTNFNPASGSVKFSWNGYLLDNDENYTNDKYKDIAVTTSDGKTDWTVAPSEEETWYSVAHRTSSNANQARISKVDDNTSGSPRTGTIKFTSATGTTEDYTFTQLKREPTVLKTQDPQITFSFDGTQYKDGDGKWNNLSGNSSKYLDITIETEDKSGDWNIEKSDNSEASGWFTVSARPENDSQNHTSIRIYPQANSGDARESKIKFTFGLGDPVEWTIQQEAHQDMTITVEPEYLEFEQDCNKNNKIGYRTQNSGNFTDTGRSSRSVSITVNTENGTYNDWTSELIEGSDWVDNIQTKTDRSGNTTINITPKKQKNNGVQQKATIRFKYANGDKKGQEITTWSFYKQGRASYEFTKFDGNTEFDYKARQSSSITVTTNPSGNSDWNVKVLDMSGNEVGGDFWLKASNAGNNKASLTLTRNDSGSQRQAQLLFYTFEGEDAKSAQTVTITQDARGAQTIESITPDKTSPYTYNEQTVKLTVVTDDDDTDWTVSTTSGAYHVTHNSGENFATLHLSEATTEVNGTVTVTSYDGNSSKTFDFTQNAKPSHFNLTFDETSWNPGYAGGQKDISVTSDPAGCADWEVESSATWLTATKNASGGLTLVAEENTEYSQRTATVSFSGPSYVTGTNTITVTQAKLITLEFGLSSLLWDGDKDNAETVKVTCRPEGFTDWDVTSDNEWFVVSKVDDATVTVKPKGKNSSDYYTPDAKNAIISFSQSDKYKSLNHVECKHNGAYCLAAGTRITMANGSTKKIEDIVEGDLVRTFNHEKGQMDAARICLTYKGGSKATPLTLSFASGKKLSIVGTHDLLSQDTRKYVRINRGNVASFVGKSFYNAESGQWDKLIGYKIDTTPVDYYCIYTTNHLNCIAEGMLTVPDDVDYFLNIYELDANLKADLKQLAADIKQYGLMDPRKDYPQYPELQALGESLLCKYLYIALAKGYVTEEEFTMLLEAFVARWS